MSINGPQLPGVPSVTPRAAVRASTASHEQGEASAAASTAKSRESAERASGIAETDNENSRPNDRTPDGRQPWRRVLRLLGLGASEDDGHDDNEPPAPEDERLDVLG